MAFTCAVFVLLLIYNILSVAHIDLHPLLQIYLSSSSAVRIRILPRAVAYLNNIGAEILNEQLPRLSIPNVKQRINNGQGYVLLSRIRVSRYKQAIQHSISTSEPNKITWIMKNLNIGLIGSLSGEVNILVPMKLEGEAEVLAYGVNLQLQSALERSETGAARLSTIFCRTTIQLMNIEIYNGGYYRFTLQNPSYPLSLPPLTLIIQGISEQIRSLIEVLICKKVTEFINEDFNKKLLQSQTKTSLADAVRINTFAAIVGLPNSKELIETFQAFNLTVSYPLFRQLVSRIYVDFRLNEDPICYKDTVEISNMGEISLVGDITKKTPFTAAPMFWPKKSKKNAMIHLLISDYIANALLYHAFSEHLLQFVVDDQTISSLGPLLHTSCATGICFADLIPQIAELYPNSKVRLIFTPTRAPVVLFQAKQGGVLMTNINGLVFMYIVESSQTSHQAAAFALDIVASLHLHVENNTLLGKTSVESFRLKNKYGYINVSDDELSDIALLSSEIFQRFINNFLRDGFPIPISKVLRTNITQLQILDRSVFISADFDLDRRRVSNFALEAFADTKYFPRNAEYASVSGTGPSFLSPKSLEESRKKMIRRDARLRLEYVYRKSLEEKQRLIDEKRQTVKKYVNENRPIPTHLRKDAIDLQQDAEWGAEVSTIDDEYRYAGAANPKIVLTTSHDPSAKLKVFSKEMRLMFPNSQRINRGHYDIKKLIQACKANDVTDFILLHETRGNPDGMVVCHLPFGPTAYFTLTNVVMRHDVPECGTMSEQYPHLIFDGLTSAVGRRLTTILKHLFPVPKTNSQRIITFANNQDFISFRHHTYSKDEHGDIKLKEIGPRFEMRPYLIKMGTIDNADAERTEWALRSYTNSARKRPLLSVPDDEE
ncbi:unnamed protein product [Litomosoides sigmodontis]|uniref:Brix domain-containing protein n=1 Tax=Litomosoides sigmodontis TaxID=42156 RepID=A0A3P6TSE2_LITSI|nr:unnamed protein product [Litomosoides sigmodontis]